MNVLLAPKWSRNIKQNGILLVKNKVIITLVDRVSMIMILFGHSFNQLGNNFYIPRPVGR